MAFGEVGEVVVGDVLCTRVGYRRVQRRVSGTLLLRTAQCLRI